jgi:uncharacterized iron-regulated membrane protein
MRAGRARAASVTIHRWAGLLLGSYVILVALTGIFLVWNRNIDAWLNPQMLRPAAVASPASVESMDAATRAVVAAGDCSLRFPDDVITAHRAICVVGDRTVEVALSSDATVLGVRYWDDYGVRPWLLVHTVHALHAELLIGAEGRTIVGIGGILMLVMLITGVVNWWPRGRGAWRHAARFPLKGPSRRLVFNFHRVGGLYMVLILSASTLSGLYLCFPDQIDAAVDVVAPFAEAPVLPDVARGGRLSMALLMEKAGRAFPTGRITDIDLPGQANVPVSVSILRPFGPRTVFGTDSVTLDPVTGRVLAVRDSALQPPQNRALALLFPIHNGEIFRLPGKLVIALGGLATAGLAGSGAWLWFRGWRNRRRRVTPGQSSIRVATNS